MRNTLGLLVLSIFALFSCKPTSETRVTKIENASAIPESGIIYALPQTNLKFTINAIKTDIIPGPYYEYAEKYMGIENVPEKESTVWGINDIIISTYNDIDPNQYYILEPSGKMNIDIYKLFKNGNVLPVNKSIENNFTNDFYGFNNTNELVIFTDLSVSKFVGQEKITYYKRVQRDSLFAKVPVTKNQSVYKSFDEKAEEAASFIFMIREKRFELLSGMADFYPDGKSMEVALNELNRLENEYLELFIGKRFRSNYTANFDFIPTNKELDQPYILFRFNEEKGILNTNDLRGRPIIIELEKKDQTKNLAYLFSDQINREGTTYKDKIYFRIPDQATVKVFDGNSLLAKRKVTIEQYGTIVQFPAMFLMNEENFIQFYRKE